MELTGLVMGTVLGARDALAEGRGLPEGVMVLLDIGGVGEFGTLRCRIEASRDYRWIS